MSLTPAEVEKIALLARLEISPADVQGYADNLSRIIDFVAHLESAPTEGVVPMAHPLDMPQRLREDVAAETDRHELYQQNAPAVEAGLYLVPKVIE